MIAGSIIFSTIGPSNPKPNDGIKVRVVSTTDRLMVEEILDQMIRIVDSRGYATIMKLQDISGGKEAYTSDIEYKYHWGWTSLKTAAILKTDEGFLLSLPPAILIDGGAKE